MSDIDKAWDHYIAAEAAAYRAGIDINPSVPRRDTFQAGWDAALKSQEKK